MAKFAANLSMLFNEHDFLDRFTAAAGAGFEAVEYLFPYAYPAEELQNRLAAHGLRQVLFNLPPGDWDKGERGLAALPGREAEFRAALDRALDYAAALNCPRVHAMAGIRPEGHSRDDCIAVFRDNLSYAARRAGERGVKLLIEPINNRDMPGYLLNTPAEAQEIIAAVGEPNLKLQLDLYHCQIMCGNLAQHVRDHFEITDHVQIAGVPGRHEPDVGEIHHPYLFRLFDELGYDGWIGCEYRPQAATEAGLGWLRQAQGQT